MDLPAITIAAVRGHCLGGGMELAAGCDLILASDDSRFGQPEISLGCFPPLAAALYPGRLGRQRSTDLLLTGRTISAREAAEIGFIARCVPAAELDQTVDDVTSSVLKHSSAVTRLAKRAIRAGSQAPFAVALAECERIYLEELTETEDMNEGLAAFLEKRAPEWNHR
jgi:cyclohexa-1,5-dienecarbonyl-CoA hydratase